MMRWEREGVQIVKEVEEEGKWGDCPLPLLCECQLVIVDWSGPESSPSQFRIQTGCQVKFVTGFCACQEDRLLEVALCSMLEGEKAVVTLDNPSIKSTIQLISFSNSGALPDWPSEKCLDVTLKLKQRGVEIFQQRRIQDAFFLFSKAFRVLSLGEGEDKQLAATLACNMAACQLEEGHFLHVIELCDYVLKIDPHNKKAMYRRGMAALHLGDFNFAKKQAIDVLKMEPANKQAASLLESAQEQASSSNSEYQAMVKKMFN